ncbi:DUF2471 domain-containing protein [Herbaspirillum sp. SJZ107]|uniref:DUF2471 domain-containing protein n=1 Tax=Herbaspirillum sp. SJZ107 TaxID=2572881 RepID=UPI00114DF264|nr:DUF2471 domain-containing protein [Herbaspirillum sp. SJZ107]
MLTMDKAFQAIRAIVPAVVARHRERGTLTWALLHQLESEVVDLAVEVGDQDKDILRMMKASPLFGYPNNQQPASFEGHEVVPPIMNAIERTWRRTH